MSGTGEASQWPTWPLQDQKKKKGNRINEMVGVGVGGLVSKPKKGNEEGRVYQKIHADKEKKDKSSIEKDEALQRNSGGFVTSLQLGKASQKQIPWGGDSHRKVAMKNYVIPSIIVGRRCLSSRIQLLLPQTEGALRTKKQGFLL